MKLGLSSHFTYSGLLRFTIAPILMMVFTSLYSIVDGLFIANFASNNAFAGVNLVFPLIMIIGAIGFMFGSGGSALVGKLLGEGKNQNIWDVLISLKDMYFTWGGRVFAHFFTFLFLLLPKWVLEKLILQIQ